MDEQLTDRILQRYGVEYRRALPMEKGYRNESHPFETIDGTPINLIVYKREPGIAARIQRANDIADRLAAEGFPARRTYDSRIVRLQSRKEGAVKFASLYHYLPGQTIPWEAYTMAHLKLLGKTMSDMHGLLCGLPAPAGLPHATDEYRVIVEHMRAYCNEPGVIRAMREKLKLQLDITIFDRLQQLLEGCKELPGQQILHMDFVRGNILFAHSFDMSRDGATIAGVLDFEKTAWGHPLFDIARTLAFLLVDCKYKDTTAIRAYFLNSGYNKRGSGPFKVTTHNARLLNRLVELFLLYDFYKFLLHNPYEFLHQNEHFGRTRQLVPVTTLRK